MSFFELLSKLNKKIHKYVQAILELDFSVLESELFGYSLLDLCGLYLALVTIKHLIVFLLNLTTKLFTAVAKMGFHYLSLQFLLYGRVIVLRALAVLKYIYTLEATQVFLKRAMNTVSKYRHRLFPIH